MQLLIKAFSVDAPVTRKTATEMAVEPEDSPAFDAVHSLLSLADGLLLVDVMVQQTNRHNG